MHFGKQPLQRKPHSANTTIVDQTDRLLASLQARKDRTHTNDRFRAPSSYAASMPVLPVAASARKRSPVQLVADDWTDGTPSSVVH